VTTKGFWIGSWMYWTLTGPWLQVITTGSLIHTLYSSLEHIPKSSQPTVSSPVFWKRLPTADIPESGSSVWVLRPIVNWPVCLGAEHPPGAYGQIFITVRQLSVCWCGALSLMRGQVCCLQLLLVLASTVILWSESRGNIDHILLSQIQDFAFCCLLRLVGLWWRYSTLPSHGMNCQSKAKSRSVGQSALE
jgi:hypothetical protein